MTKILLSFVFLGAFMLNAEDVIYLTCKTPSGKSIYDLAIPEGDEKTGEIRLRFDGQDILYSAKVKIVDSIQIVGVAKYKASRSGHADAKPWVFTYKKSSKQLIDDGQLTAQCE
jgi:hypothetical protein